jgi:hypothetical protein
MKAEKKIEAAQGDLVESLKPEAPCLDSETWVLGESPIHPPARTPL